MQSPPPALIASGNQFGMLTRILEEPAHVRRVFERVVRRRHPVAAADDDGDAAPRDRRNRILVGQIVIDIEGQRIALAHPGVAEQPFDRPPLIPVGARLDLEDLLAAPLAQLRMAPDKTIDRLLYLLHSRLRHIAEMRGDREGLALDFRALDAGDRFAQLGISRLDRPQETRCLVRPLMQDVRSGNVEPMAADIEDLIEPDPPAHVVKIASADYGSREPLSELRHGIHRVARDIGFAIIANDRRQCAVIVEEDRRRARADPLIQFGGGVEDRWQPLDRPQRLAIVRLQPAQVAHDDIGAMRAERCVACRSDHSAGRPRPPSKTAPARRLRRRRQRPRRPRPRLVRSRATVPSQPA